AADADVAAGGVLHGDRQLAHRIPAAVLPGRAGHAVVRAGPGRPAVDATRGPVCLLGAAVRVPVHLAVDEGADRSAGELLHHPGQLRPATPPAAGAVLALVDAGLGGRRAGYDHQGRGRAGPADGAAGGDRLAAWLAAGAPARARLALLAGPAGVPGRGGGMAGAGGRRGPLPGPAGIPLIPGR